jgi:hypothetical protein
MSEPGHQNVVKMGAIADAMRQNLGILGTPK